MDVRMDSMEPGSGRMTVRSVSHHTLTRDHKPPAEGLKKLAANYRNTFKTNKLDIDKFRASLKDKRALTDPRFRRERTRSPKKPAVETQSESVFPLQDSHHGPNVVSVSTPIFNMKNQSDLQNIRHMQNNINEADQQNTPELSNIGEVDRFSNKPSRTYFECATIVSDRENLSKCIDAIAKHDSIKKSLDKDSIKNTFEKESIKNTFEREPSMKNTFEREWSKKSVEKDSSKKSAMKESSKKSIAKDSSKSITIFEKDVGTSSPNIRSLVPSKTSIDDFTSKYQLGPSELIKLNFLNNQSLWKEHLFSRNNLGLKDMRKSHSAVTLPICYHKFTEQVCMCVKCSYANRKEMHGGYVFDSNTDMESLNSAIISCADTKPSDMERYYQCCLYVAGCFMGILFVAFLAWLVSSDILWSYFIEETPKKQSFILNVGTFFGRWLLFGLNYVFGSIYNLFVLPRNAVFHGVQEKHWFWKFVDNFLETLL